MSAQQVGKLFGRFQRLEEAHTRGKGGTGLGLAISRALAREMARDVTCESGVGLGSVFRFSLPALAHASPPDLDEPTRAPTRAPGAARDDLERETSDVAMALVSLLVTYEAELPRQVDDLATRLRTLRQLATKASWDDAHRLAHTLRGTAGSYGLDLVSEAARALVDALDLVRHEAAAPASVVSDSAPWLVIDDAFARVVEAVGARRG